jgi:hypothetical protein
MRPLRFLRSVVGRRELIQGSVHRRHFKIGRRWRFVHSNGEPLKSPCCLEQLPAFDVRVARDRREVSVSKVLGDEASVAELLTQPGRGGVAQRVRGDVLLDPGARGGAADDVGEDRLLQPPALEPAEDGVGRFGLARGAQPPQLTRDARR